MSEPRVVLHQFERSHFNEKARWALDWKRVRHRRESYLPGPHAPQIKRLSGQTSTPVLVIDGEVVAGAAAILERLERRFPDPALYPVEPALRERALAIQAEWDAEVGPATRTAIFSVLIEEPDYLCRMFAGSKSRAKRLAYRAAFPIARRMMARAHETDDPAAVKHAFGRSRSALDFVAKHAAPGEPLVGDRFSVADLCCAALLAPLTRVSHPDMARPEPMPPRMSAFLESWQDHPGSAWVQEVYARHRPSR